MGCTPLDKQKQKHKKGLWSPDEDMKLKSYILKHGHGCWSSVPINTVICTCRWSQISQHLPGRTDNEIKNYWHSYLKKRMAKTVETEDHVKDEYTNVQNRISELSPSSLKSTPHNSNYESFENMEGSLIETDQSQNCNLPKVFFAEWLSLDQFHVQDMGGNFDHFNNIFESQSSNDSIMMNEGTFDTKSNSVSYDDMLQLPFKFEDQISESGLVDYFPVFIFPSHTHRRRLTNQERSRAIHHHRRSKSEPPLQAEPPPLLLLEGNHTPFSLQFVRFVSFGARGKGDGIGGSLRMEARVRIGSRGRGIERVSEVVMVEATMTYRRRSGEDVEQGNLFWAEGVDWFWAWVLG
ncbi:hypothetical protein RD792_005355 [Penstemon davidsonii]|uniref:Uncharacterized protein n=1 Tax=Penstemon davidsonii TaxID=160366 RepID=A0ABR0DKU1_9LAMI|nr:hypothetical protein RD792_005355 [Penstemon davidsonii]